MVHEGVTVDFVVVPTNSALVPFVGGFDVLPTKHENVALALLDETAIVDEVDGPWELVTCSW